MPRSVACGHTNGSTNRRAIMCRGLNRLAPSVREINRNSPVLSPKRAATSPLAGAYESPNKFPALTPDAAPGHLVPGLHVMIGGYGAHEIVIEHPRHDADLIKMDDDEITAVIECYQRRFTELAGRPGIETVVLFRNHGPSASTRHPHAQLIALGLATPKLRLLADWACQHYRKTGRCPTCEEIELETKLNERVVDESRHFLALVPFAAERPCEVWLMPKRHQGSFAEIAE